MRRPSCSVFLLSLYAQSTSSTGKDLSSEHDPHLLNNSPLPEKTPKANVYLMYHHPEHEKLLDHTRQLAEMTPPRPEEERPLALEVRLVCNRLDESASKVAPEEAVYRSREEGASNELRFRCWILIS